MRVSKQQLEWTTPSVSAERLAPNFTKIQMVPVSLYVNGMTVYFLLTCPASGMGVEGDTRTNNVKEQLQVEAKLRVAEREREDKEKWHQVPYIPS